MTTVIAARFTAISLSFPAGNKFPHPLHSIEKALEELSSVPPEED